MKVEVKFFASYRELVGKEEEELHLEKGAMLRDLRRLVVAAHPILKDVKDSMLTSLNEALVDDEEIELNEGDVIALFPSLSGG